MTEIDESQSLIGKVASCRIGQIGLITGVKDLPWGKSWIGQTLDDNSPWASQSPIVLANSLEEYRENEKHSRG